MSDEAKVEVEIIPAEHGDVISEALTAATPAVGPKWVHHWLSLKYVMQADIAQKGLQQARVRQVIGRAVGEREDGQAFSAYVDIPWVMPGDYQWQPRALKRLNTFLYDCCFCEAKDSETRTCPWHLHIASEWQSDDFKEIRYYEGAPQDMPSPQRGAGPIAPLLLMHRDYPWCRLDAKRQQWVCAVCGYREDSQMNNSTWRNVFIRKHSGCGIQDPDRILPWSIEDKVLNELGQRMEQEFQRTGWMAFDTARAWVLNQRGTLVIQDNRKPHELPANEKLLEAEEFKTDDTKRLDALLNGEHS